MENQYQLSKEFADKWLSALRSGDYEQGRLRFEFNCQYCALGVALKANGLPVFIGEDHDNWDELHRHVREELTEDIYYLNDCKNLTFPEIADWIEQNVELI